MDNFLPNFDEIIKTVDFNIALFYAVILTFCVLSGCWSASIAEKKARGTVMHLLLGLGLPVVYPFLITVALPSRLKKEVIEEPKEVEDDDLDLPFQDLNAAYFKKIYLDSSGNPTGPFIIDTEDSVIKAEVIVEVQEDFIVAETLNKDNERQRLRVPYSKMTSCSEA